MPPVPVLKPREVVKAFETLGWEVARQRGSHIILTRNGHIATLSVPNHPEVARGTLRSLIARAGLTVDEFLIALKSR
jgi:predicted RNA binding protein YcfA (HicA-like mRNA interferase family)